jgi:MoxR-like ATPase
MTTSSLLLERPDRLTPAPAIAVVARLRSRLRAALRGKDEACDLALACLLARGHLLIEDAPGLGKTTLAKAVAALVGGRFNRIQCTPDLLPSDITGFTIYDQHTGRFEFRAGPVFADVLLADEINRATPRCQSALLEAMSERQVTSDNASRPLAANFFVVATQNPLEHLGTYPLPEAQLDRFALALRIGPPDRTSEIELLQQAQAGCAADIGDTEPLLDPAGLIDLQEAVVAVPVADRVVAYLVDLGRWCRERLGGQRGPSPRGLLVWQRVAQAWALLEGRDHVLPDDVRQVAVPVLGVRLGLPEAETAAVVAAAMDHVSVPVGR